MKTYYTMLLWIGSFFWAVYAHAGGVSITNVQQLYGDQFDVLVGGGTVDKIMKTTTIEHFSTWGYGDNYFFVDLTSGNFGDGREHQIYGEWAPRLSLSKITQKDLSVGFVKDFYLAGQVNHGNNFRADLLGVGMNLKVPGFKVLGINLYQRDDHRNDAVGQVTLVWTNRFELGIPWIFRGFLDWIEGADDQDDSIIAQPQFLADIGSLFDNAGKLQLGIEWYHYSKGDVDETVPQVMARWIW